MARLIHFATRRPTIGSSAKSSILGDGTAKSSSSTRCSPSLLPFNLVLSWAPTTFFSLGPSHKRFQIFLVPGAVGCGVKSLAGLRWGWGRPDEAAVGSNLRMILEFGRSFPDQ
jgi:hypothetical protein